MDFSFENIGFIALIVLTGLSAGLCFTWSNAITSGIGRLTDLGFLQSFQQMNRTIINPTFIIVFFGPFLLGLINLYLFRNTPVSFFWLFTSAIAIYFFGVVLVTIFGNVPLNELLDKTDLSSASLEELRELRDRFEVKWNQLHLIRTVTSIASFILLIICLFQSTKQ
tara:strand:- start:81854 stop:82354 length:501 start_codon:yes stop_codon:yes gene_type:complete